MRQLFILMAMAIGFSAHADITVKGYTFPETKVVDGKTLYLNGAGLRTIKKFGLTIQIYVAGLYLENNHKSAKEVMNDPGLKYFHSVYLRGGISKKKQKDAWKDSMREGCHIDCAGSKETIRKMFDYIVKTKKGGEVNILFYPDKVKVEAKGSSEASGEVSGANFSKDLLGLWIGPKSTIPNLKKDFMRGRGEGVEAPKTDGKDMKKDMKKEPAKK